jgi:hypothetical protein
MTAPPVVGGYESQTITLFVAVGVTVLALLLYGHFSNSKGAAAINLWDLIKDDGRASGRKAIELGGFIAMTIWCGVEVIRGTPSETLLLGYAGLCIAGRVAGQVVNLKNKRLELDNESAEIWDVAANSPQREPARASKVSSE